MHDNSALLLLAVGLGWFILLRRYNAFRLRTDFWSMLAAGFVIPVLVAKLLRPELSEKLLVAAMAPSFLMFQYALYLATLCEADKLRALRRDVARWRLFTGTAPKGYAATPHSRERRLSGRTLAISLAIAGAVAVYAVLCFGWSSLIDLAVLFWGLVALYQFSFSPDNQA